MFLVNIYSITSRPNIILYFLMIIIKLQRLYYFLAKTKYFQLLIYFENTSKIEKLIFDAFI